MVAGLLNLADVTLSALIDGTVLLGRAAVKCFAQGHRGDMTAQQWDQRTQSINGK